VSHYVRSTICAVLVLIAGRTWAQTGIVTGTVHDQKTGEELLGANILLTGTSLGASADLEGKFTIRAVPPGTYSMRVSYVGYAPKLVNAVVVKPGETTVMNVLLSQEAEEAKEEVVVTAERVRSTEAAVLSERQKAATIGDAVSAEQIKRSPDATSGDAIKRVTGVTIANDKFIFVRGVTDRYNGTELNGVSVTSTDTDVDRKSFSFDMVPANLLENTVVVKTASPDLPGDFSGGLVQVNTLDFPATRTLRVGLSSSYDRATTTETMYAGQGGGHDWTGRDDGSRALPEGNLQGNDLARALPNNWELKQRQAPFDKSFGLSFGDRWGVGKDELGFVGALSYRTTFETNEFTQRPSYQDVPLFSFDGDRYHRTVLWGGLANLNYKLGTHHKFSFRNNYVQSADEKVNIAAGLPASGEYSKKQTEEWDQRYFYLTQLGGEHQLPVLADLQVAWKGYYARSQAEEPDRKQVSYERGSGNAYSLKENYRTWSDLSEESRGATLDVTKPWKSLRLKAGGLFDRRTRDYGIQAYASDPSNLSPPNYGLVALPIAQIFAPENYGPGKFNFIPITVFTGEYSGQHDLAAGYGLADVQRPVAGLDLRFMGGLRVEDSDIEVNSIAQTGDPRPVTARLTNTDWLPSANLTWKARDNANLRLAYGRSLNRPEFRELADVLYYDFDNEQNVLGNPDLQRALIDNYDVRAEWFPNVGEVLAASYFYKHLQNAIEEELIPSPERYVRTWFNSPKGKNHGFELEARKSMGFLHAQLHDLSLTGNYTRVFSEIQYTESRTDGQGNSIVTEEHRVMQGQAPWTVNLALQFNSARLGTSASVLYGKLGRRLDAVGDTRDEDVYEESRDLLDLSATQRFRGRWEAKMAVKNLLAEDELLTIGPERSTFARLTKQREYSVYLALGL
jgi:outer membrane receptor protein involved in Fe transport